MAALSFEVPVIICLALCKIDTSKLFDRLDRVMPWSGASVFADDVDGFDLPGDVSSTLWISVADDANDVINDLKSVLATDNPVRLKKLVEGDLAAPDVDGVMGTGISEARLNDAAGIGANGLEPTKSEYRRFVYRVALELPASLYVCTSHTFSLLVFHSFMRALRACTMSSIMSSCKL